MCGCDVSDMMMSKLTREQHTCFGKRFLPSAQSMIPTWKVPVRGSGTASSTLPALSNSPASSPPLRKCLSLVLLEMCWKRAPFAKSGSRSRAHTSVYDFRAHSFALGGNASTCKTARKRCGRKMIWKIRLGLGRAGMVSYSKERLPAHPKGCK